MCRVHASPCLNLKPKGLIELIIAHLDEPFQSKFYARNFNSIDKFREAIIITDDIDSELSEEKEENEQGRKKKK